MAAQQTQGQRLASFLRATKKNKRTQPYQVGPTTGTNTTRYDLPKVGYISDIILLFTTVFTTAATGTYANSTARGIPNVNITPFNLISRIRIESNVSSPVVFASPWSIYLYNRTMQNNFDVRNPIASYDSTNTAASIYNLPSSYTTATQYTLKWALRVPVAVGENLAASLMLLQNQAAVLSLVIEWADPTACLTLGGTTPSLTVSSNVCKPTIRYWDVPANAIDDPDISQVRQLFETVESVTALGDYSYNLPTGVKLLSCIQEHFNNGAGIDPAKLGRFRYGVAQSLFPFDYDVDAHVFDIRERLGGMDLPDGVLYHDFSHSFSQRLPDNRDVLDLGLVTDARLITNWGSGIGSLTNAGVRTLRDQLLDAS